MKLMFPNGEHPVADLHRGINRIGASPGCGVVLRGPAMPPLACEIHVFATYAYLVPNADALVIFNGHRIRELMRLNEGDVVELSGTRMRVISSVATPGDDYSEYLPQRANTGRNETYQLRGISGACIGATYLLPGAVLVGRDPACDVVLPTADVSRRHARLCPMSDGVMVNDLGSKNGVWINDERVTCAPLRSGDVLRLGNTMRFLLETIAVDLTGPQPCPQPVTKHALPKSDAALAVSVTAVAVVGIVMAFRTLHALLLVAQSGFLPTNYLPRRVAAAAPSPDRSQRQRWPLRGNVGLRLSGSFVLQ